MMNDDVRVVSKALHGDYTETTSLDPVRYV